MREMVVVGGGNKELRFLRGIACFPLLVAVAEMVAATAEMVFGKKREAICWFERILAGRCAGLGRPNKNVKMLAGRSSKKVVEKR